MNRALKQYVDMDGRPKQKIATEANMGLSDLCQVINGKKYCHPGWRRRISEVLGVPESELFPEETSKDT